MPDINKIALITGGSRGLGRSAALALARSGIDVVITYHSQEDAAADVVKEIESLGRKAAALRLDVAALPTFPAFVGALGEKLTAIWSRDTVDFLVNNGAYGLTASFVDTTEELFDQMMAVHLKGVFFFTQAMLPLIADGGRILNTSSGLTRFTFPGYAAYGAMKGGIEVLTRCLAKELGPRGISVNTIAPGAIETDFGGGDVRDNPELKKVLTGLTALGRVGVPEDIGPLIAALLSESGRWVNGQRIEATGGMML